MKTLVNLLTPLILASWIVAIAILSVQNASSVSLRFLTFESIKLPAGLVLAFSVGVGMLAGAISPVIWQVSAGQKPLPLEDSNDYNEEPEFEEDRFSGR